MLECYIKDAELDIEKLKVAIKRKELEIKQCKESMS